MVASEAPDWLPSGWTVQVKVHDYGRKVKKYCNLETGQKFYSKKDVLQYTEQNASQSTPQPSSKQKKSLSKDNTPIVEQSSENPEWLPRGWITEVKIKGGSGKPYKIYIDPESGSKFYSKPEVSRYLDSVSAGTIGQKKTGASPVIKPDVDGVTGRKSSLKRDASQNRRTDRSKNPVTKQEEISISNHSIDNVLTERGTPDELPPGWIKEIKIRKSVNGMRKYPSYTDPVSGYVFSSKKDALRYVETGSIDSCVVKPKKRETNDQELTSDNVPRNNGQSAKVKPSSSKPDESANVKSSINKSGIHKQANVSLGEPSTNNAVTENESPEELPPGWIKEIKTKKIGNRAKKYMQYTDPLSGYIFNSKRDALRYLGTGDIGSCTTKPRKRDTDDPELINGKISAIIHSLTGLESFLEPDVTQNNGNTVKIDSVMASADKAVNESGSADELPSGWIKEIKTKKSINGTKKYQLYVEPSTGYEFRSKKDALRYVETGDINKCAVKPKKREMNNPELIDAVVSTNEKIDGVIITNSKIDEKIDEVTIMNSHTDEKKEEVPEWLPSGWTMEYKTQRGATPRKYKCYVDPNTGRKFYSKPEVSRYLKTVNIGTVAPNEDKEVEPVGNDNLTGGKCSLVPDNSVDCKPIESKPEEKQVGVDKHSIKNVAIERLSTDELPPGWIKEIRIKEGINGTRKEPYYIDPLSGYEFRSLKDALRFVQTGDIRKCAIRPRKREKNEPSLTNGNISSPSPLEAKDSSQRTTRQQISEGKECSGPETHEENHLLDNAKESSDSKTKSSKRKRDTEKSAENMSIATPATTKASKRNRRTKISAEKVSISTPTTSQLSKQKGDLEASSENETATTTTDILTAKSVDRKTQVDTSKPKRKRALSESSPTRTSKRLVGLEPDTPINLWFGAPVGIGGALEEHQGDHTQTITRLVGLEPEPPINLGFNEVGPDVTPNSATQVVEADKPINLGSTEAGTDMLEVEPEREIAPHDYAEEMLSAELLNKIEKALQEHAAIVDRIEKPLEEQTVTEEQHETPAVRDEVIEKPFEHQDVIYELIEKPLENQAIIKDPTEKPQEEQQEKPIEKQNDEVAAPPGMQNQQVFYPMMESWSDPCLEFAFKTLTGALPVEDNTGSEGYFQGQVEPQPQNPAHNNGDLSSFQGLPNYFQNPFSLNLNEPQRPVPRPGPGPGHTQQFPTQQFPINPTYMPSSSNGGTQQNPTWK